MVDLVHEFIHRAAARTPAAQALVYGTRRLSYAQLAGCVDAAAQAFLAAGVRRAQRVAVYLEKRIENVTACFGATAAGAVFVPVNPLLKAQQVSYILDDCQVTALVTSAERLRGLAEVLASKPHLTTIFVVGEAAQLPVLEGVTVLAWNEGTPETGLTAPRVIDGDMAAILYTSGSTGKPKGVVLSHRNIVAGALSVASYLELSATDRLLAVLPLSFDYGLSQLTTAFHVGACVVLINHLFARDIVKAVAAEAITGLAAVPPLWIQLAQLPWPADCTLRYLTNSGGAMPRATVDTLRKLLPAARLYLMYGLTEAFRSTYLAPEELDRRPDSMGRAIPNAEILVVRPDGTLCDANEPGELVHRGALVAMGYWNDPAKTAERFRPAPGRDSALPLTEIAVWSGDTVRRDQEGFLYFVGRSDDMIKVSGYRVSPTEVEEALHGTGMVAEVAAFGVPHPQLGSAIVVVAMADGIEVAALLKECQRRLPAYMVPGHIELRTEALPRNPNGKIDRTLLRQTYLSLFESTLT